MDGWLKIKKSCTISITKGLKIKKGIKKAIKTPIQDGFTIGGFKSSRTNKSSLNLEEKKAAEHQEIEAVRGSITGGMKPSAAEPFGVIIELGICI